MIQTKRILISPQSLSRLKRYAALAVAVPFVGFGWAIGSIFKVADLVRAAVREGFEAGSRIV